MPSKQRRDREAVALHEALADHDEAVLRFYRKLDSNGDALDDEQRAVLESWRDLRRYFSAQPGVDRATWLGEVRKRRTWSEEHGEMTALRVSGTGRVH